MQYSPVPSPEGTKQTYWETKAPSSDVLGIGSGVSSGTYITSSVVAALVGGFCTGQVRAVPLSGYVPSFAVPMSCFTPLFLCVPIPRVSLPTSHLEHCACEQLDSISKRLGEISLFFAAGRKPRQQLCTPYPCCIVPQSLLSHKSITPSDRTSLGSGGLV